MREARRRSRMIENSLDTLNLQIISMFFTKHERDGPRNVWDIGGKERVNSITNINGINAHNGELSMEI
jgi:hypothetical protein